MQIGSKVGVTPKNKIKQAVSNRMTMLRKKTWETWDKRRWRSGKSGGDKSATVGGEKGKGCGRFCKVVRKKEERLSSGKVTGRKME